MMQAAIVMNAGGSTNNKKFQRSFCGEEFDEYVFRNVINGPFPFSPVGRRVITWLARLLEKSTFQTTLPRNVERGSRMWLETIQWESKYHGDGLDGNGATWYVGTRGWRRNESDWKGRMHQWGERFNPSAMSWCCHQTQRHYPTHYEIACESH